SVHAPLSHALPLLRAPSPTELHPLSLHDALPIYRMLSQPSLHTKRPYARSTVNDRVRTVCRFYAWAQGRGWIESLPFHFVEVRRSEEHTSELQSRENLVCRLLLEKKKDIKRTGGE